MKSGGCVLSGEEVSEPHQLLTDCFPGRTFQTRSLRRMFSCSSSLTINSVYVYGPPGSGKTNLIITLLNNIPGIRYITVYCAQCYDCRTLYSCVLSKLMELLVSDIEGGTGIVHCDNAADFIFHLKRILGNKGATFSSRIIILLKGSEYLNEQQFQLFSSLTKIIKCPLLTVMFISTLPPYWKKNTFINTTVCLPFPRYNKSETMRVLPLLLQVPLSHHSVLENLIKLFVPLMFPLCRDLLELKTLMEHFVQCCLEQQDLNAALYSLEDLYKAVAPLLKGALEQIKQQSLHFCSVEDKPKPNKNKSTFQVDLPYFSKCLLTSAYFTSMNSSKNDSINFLKHSLKRKRKNKGHLHTNKNIQGAVMSHSVPLGRLLAAFSCLSEKSSDIPACFLSQISSLVEVKMVEWDESLDKPQYRCNNNPIHSS